MGDHLLATVGVLFFCPAWTPNGVDRCRKWRTFRCVHAPLGVFAILLHVPRQHSLFGSGKRAFAGSCEHKPIFPSAAVPMVVEQIDLEGIAGGGLRGVSGFLVRARGTDPDLSLVPRIKTGEGRLGLDGLAGRGKSPNGEDFH